MCSSCKTACVNCELLRVMEHKMMLCSWNPEAFEGQCVPEARDKVVLVHNVPWLNICKQLVLDLICFSQGLLTENHFHKGLQEDYSYLSFQSIPCCPFMSRNAYAGICDSISILISKRQQSIFPLVITS